MSTPYYYNGDEIGMVNAKFNDDYRDIETLAEYEK
jgi:oligo-1,6-glucosidase